MNEIVLKAGDIIRYIHNYEHEYSKWLGVKNHIQILTDKEIEQLFEKALNEDTWIISGVWKGNLKVGEVFHPRKRIKLP